MCRNVRKRTFLYVWTTNTLIRLRERAVWSEYTLFTGTNFAFLIIPIQIAPCEDSDQTVQMRRLIWIFFERVCPNVRLLTLRLINLYFW